MKYFNRKNVVFGVLIVLLAVSGFLNWNYNKGAGEEAKVLGEAAYVDNKIDVQVDSFETMKIERNIARDETLKSLNEVINNPNSSEGAKADAENEVLFINQSRIQEVDCETILKNKGVKEVMVSISRSGVNVFVKNSELHPNEVAIITETVKTQTPFSQDMIKISKYD